MTNVFTGSKQVTRAFFGANYNTYVRDPVEHSIARSHDFGTFGGCQWCHVEPSRGNYNWAAMDTFVDANYSAGREIIVTLFGTPAWASARPQEVGTYGINYAGNAAEPSDLTYWDEYCAAVAKRYGKKIDYYEIWNEVNLTGFWSGTPTILSQMTRRAAKIIKDITPDAKIISPSICGWQGKVTSASSYFHTMMSASDGAGGTMAAWIDIVGVHLYPDNYDGINLLPNQLTAIRASMKAADVQDFPLFNTEFSIGNFASLDQSSRASAIARLMVLSAAHQSGGADRSVWYGMNNVPMGFTSDDVSQWNMVRAILTYGPITSVDIVRGKVEAVIGGGKYVF